MKILKGPVTVQGNFPKDGQYVREEAKGNPGDADYKPEQWFIATADGKKIPVTK